MWKTEGSNLEHLKGIWVKVDQLLLILLCLAIKSFLVMVLQHSSEWAKSLTEMGSINYMQTKGTYIQTASSLLVISAKQAEQKYADNYLN